MYCIRKYDDCWRVFNLDSELGRPLSMEEMQRAMIAIEPLRDSDVLSYYTDKLDWMDDKP